MPNSVPHCLSVLKTLKKFNKGSKQLIREKYPPKIATRRCFKSFSMSVRSYLLMLRWGAMFVWESERMQKFCSLSQRCVVSLQSVVPTAVPTGLSDWRRPVQEMPNLWDTWRFFLQGRPGLVSGVRLAGRESRGGGKAFLRLMFKVDVEPRALRAPFFISAQELITHVEQQ